MRTLTAGGAVAIRCCCARRDGARKRLRTPEKDAGRGWRRAVIVDADALVTVADAAETLSRSTEQVRRYLREGRLTGKRIGNQWFIDRAVLLAFGQELREERGFLERIKPASETDPLGMVIGIASGRGSNMADGKDSYRAAPGWRR